MDVKDLKTESALSEHNNDGSKYSQKGGIALHCDRNKSFQDIGSNSLAKVDVQTTRPCAVIGPDRVVPPPAPSETYLKKPPADPWSCLENTYYTRRPPEYPHKLSNFQNPTRNISPRQTFQENMQRIMVPPTYNSVKINDDTNFPQIIDRNNAVSKNIKLNVQPETKFCDVPYTFYPNSNEQKNIRNTDMSLSNVNPSLTRTVPHGWPTGSINIRPTRTYGASELYQYQEYPNCAGPRPIISRPRNVPEEASYVYAEPFYHQEGNIRFKPYPTVKERFPHQRYNYIGNYANSFHSSPTFHPNKYDLQKPVPPHPYPPYPSIKYLERAPETIMDGYQRTPQAGYNIPYHNQVIHPNYTPILGNCPPNKVHSYPSDGHIKPVPPNKIAYDNTKAYIEYENGRSKMHPPSESYLVNEMGRMHSLKNQVVMPNYPTLNIPPNTYYKKDNHHLNNYEYLPAQYRNMDPSLNIHNPVIRHGTVFSPTTLAISPTDSSASNDTSQTLGISQEDCGYVSQSSTASIRSIDSGINRIANEHLQKYYDSRFGSIMRSSSMMSKSEVNMNNNYKERKNLNVRQFLQMWNEGDEEPEENNPKEIAIPPGPKNEKFSNTHDAINQPNQEQLYVLGLVNVPNEELGKYEHIQKVSKLPENIKGYNHIELLNQFEKAIESSNMSNYKMSVPQDYQTSSKGVKQTSNLMPPRPLSPLDVEAKISQSVIHKEVGCNFEIKPCSPKMLNVDVATPVQNILTERTIEKIANPLMLKSPGLNIMESNIDCSMNRQNNKPIANNEHVRISSCKMANSPFSNHNMDSIKNCYSLQDLESSSGLCLASLPRLDNDIELNFPEVNQQFINANKGDTSLASSIKDLPMLEELDQSVNQTQDELNIVRILAEHDVIKSPCVVDSEKEFSKLSKYRKIKTISSDLKENLNAKRTDSVIIKNPENSKNSEDNLFLSNCVAQNTDIQNAPINLTSQGNILDDVVTTAIIPQIRKEKDTAIDFSINKTSSIIECKEIKSLVYNTTIKTDCPINDDHLTKSAMFSDCEHNDSLGDNTDYTKKIASPIINPSLEETLKENKYLSPMPTIKKVSDENDDMSSMQTNTVSSNSPLPMEMITTSAKYLQTSDDVTTEKNHDLNINNLKNEDIQNDVGGYMDGINDDEIQNQLVKAIDNNHCSKVRFTKEDLESDIDTHDSNDSNFTDADRIIVNEDSQSTNGSDKGSITTEMFENKLVRTKNNLVSCSNGISKQFVPETESHFNIPSPKKSTTKSTSKKSDESVSQFTHSPDDYQENNNVHQNYPNTDEASCDVIGIASRNCDNVINVDTGCNFHPNDNFPKDNNKEQDNNHNLSSVSNNIVTNYTDKHINNSKSLSEDITSQTVILDLICTEKRDCEDVLCENNDTSKTAMILAVEEERTHVRRIMCVGKNMYSPWIQNLLLYCEGNINIQNTVEIEQNVELSDFRHCLKNNVSQCSHKTCCIKNSLLSERNNKIIINGTVEPSYSCIENNSTTDDQANYEERKIVGNNNIPCSKNKFEDQYYPLVEEGMNNAQDIKSIFSTSTSASTTDEFKNEVTKVCHKLDVLQVQKQSDALSNCIDNMMNNCDKQQSTKTLVVCCDKTNDNPETPQKLKCELGYQGMHLNCSIEKYVQSDKQISDIKDISLPLDSQCTDNKVITEKCNRQTNSNDEIPEQKNQYSNSSEETSKITIGLSKTNKSVTKLITVSNKFIDKFSTSPVHKDSSSTDLILQQNNTTDKQPNSHNAMTEQCVRSPDCNSDISEKGNKEMNHDDEIIEQWDTQPNCQDEISKRLVEKPILITGVTEQVDTQLINNVEPPHQFELDNQINFSNRISEHMDRLATCINDTPGQWDKQSYYSELSQQREKQSDCDDKKFTYVEKRNLACLTSTDYRLENKRQLLKRSLSDSALNVLNINGLSHKENEENIPFLWPFKRRKINNVDNNLLAQNLCSIIQSNRRNSVSSFYNEENVSFCILIDDSCIIAEENDEQEKICYSADMQNEDECLTEVQNDYVSDEENDMVTQVIADSQQENDCEYSDSYMVQDEYDNIAESWIEDVGCIETFISDDIAENVEISGPSSPKDGVLSDNDESGVFSSSEHTDKVKYIYGKKMCNNDAQFVETLYNTPQMDVNKTLVRRESFLSAECYDNDSLEKILSESNENEMIPYMCENEKPIFSSEIVDVKELREKMAIQNPCQEPADVMEDVNNKIDVKNVISDQSDLVHSCETSIDDVSTYNENDANTNYVTSSSPEVSSTTSEEKNSAILLKITNYKGSRVSQVNNIGADEQKSSCKFTEDKDYVQSHVSFPTHRPLLTKAAQKYIPPLKESMRDLKVKLSLPTHSLMKLKKLKKSKEEPKVCKRNISLSISSKKPKPKFEDVLKSIDEIQFKMHKEKAKKSKNYIPKVVIKKNENGSHYASTSTKKDFNPDLTGRKWQPWVFIEKNHFIDKMVIKRKTKAIYSHRKRTYVLAEKFQKYKSVNSANFVITPPKSDCPSTGLKYTIRLKHN